MAQRHWNPRERGTKQVSFYDQHSGYWCPNTCDVIIYMYTTFMATGYIIFNVYLYALLQKVDTLTFNDGFIIFSQNIMYLIMSIHINDTHQYQIANTFLCNINVYHPNMSSCNHPYTPTHYGCFQHRPQLYCHNLFRLPLLLVLIWNHI